MQETLLYFDSVADSDSSAGALSLLGWNFESQVFFEAERVRHVRLFFPASDVNSRPLLSGCFIAEAGLVVSIPVVSAMRAGLLPPYRPKDPFEPASAILPLEYWKSFDFLFFTCKLTPAHIKPVQSPQRSRVICAQPPHDRYTALHSKVSRSKLANPSWWSGLSLS